MWVKLNNFFKEELFDNFKVMRDTTFTYENLCKYLIEDQIDSFPEIAYNQDIYAKYIAQGRRYLHMLHGSDKAHIKRWLYNRFLYVDSLFLQQNSPYTKKSITIRSNCPTYGSAIENLPSGVRYRPVFTIETYVPQYVTVCWRKNTYETKRVGWNESVEFTYDMVNSQDNEIIVYCANNLKRIGDCTDKRPTSIDIGEAYKLVEFTCHDSDVLLKADLSKNTYLKTADFKGCTNLGNTTGGANVLDVSKCTNLRSLDIRGTSITSVNTNADGGNLEEILYSEKTESVVLQNQTNLRVVGLPADPVTTLKNVSLKNCHGIVTMKYPYSVNDTIDFESIKYTNALSLDNSLDITKIGFEGFNRLTDLTLINMLELSNVYFDNMLGKEDVATLKSVTINNCPKIKTLTMDITDEDHKIAFDEATLDLRAATTITKIHANSPLIGLKNVYLPTNIKDLIFAHDYNQSVSSDIINIFSNDAVEASQTDGFSGIDLLNVHVQNIDLSSVKRIVNSRNMNMIVEDTFIVQGTRDNVVYPYLVYNGRVDLTNYAGSYVKSFANWDMRGVELVYTKDITQSNFTSMFEGAILGDKINTILTSLFERLKNATILSSMFKNSDMDRILFPNSSQRLTCIDMFSGCKNITSIGTSTQNFKIPSNVIDMTGMFRNCKNLEEAHITIPDLVTDIVGLFNSCTLLDNIDNTIVGRGVIRADQWLGSKASGQTDVYETNSSITSANNVQVLPTNSLANSNITFAGCNKLQTCSNLLWKPDWLDNVFNGCGSLLQVSFAPGSSPITSMRQTFRQCRVIPMIDFTNLDTSRCTNYESAFYWCESLTEAPIKYFHNGSIMTTVYYKCAKITNFDNLTVGTGIKCPSNPQAPGTMASNWNLDCSSVASAKNMTLGSNLFFGAWSGYIPKIKSIEGLTIDPKLYDISEMFKGNTYIQTDFNIPSHIMRAESTFQGCTGINSVHANWNNAYTNGITPTNCYSGCTGITSIDGMAGTLDNIPTEWGGQGVIMNLSQLSSLSDISGTGNVEYIHLSEEVKSKLTAEDIAEVSNKGYTIV